MPAESANTVSFVPSRLRPSVAHAASLSFIASSRRPSRPRRIAITSSDTSANTTAVRTICEPGSSKRLPNRFERVDADRPVLEQVDLDEAEHLEARQREDPAVEDHRERGGAEREVDAGEAQGRERDERADRGGDQHRPHQRERVAVRAQVGHHDAADAGEAQLAERDLARRTRRAGTSDSATIPIENTLP